MEGLIFGILRYLKYALCSYNVILVVQTGLAGEQEAH